MVWKRWACSVRVCDGGVISRTEAASWNIWQLKLVLTLGHSVVNSLVTYGRDTVFYKWKGDFILELHISCEKEKKCMLCHCTLSLNWMFQTFCSLMDSKSSFRCSYQQRECGSQIKQAEASHLATGGGGVKKNSLCWLKEKGSNSYLKRGRQTLSEGVFCPCICVCGKQNNTATASNATFHFYDCQYLSAWF